MPNPVDNPELYDVLVLGGVRSPGVVKISGAQRKIDWDNKIAKGQKGATSTLSGIPLAEFTAEFFLADTEDFDAWPAFLQIINSTISGTTPKAIDVYHPDLAEQGIVSVVKVTTEATKHDGKGGQTKIVKFQEYSPPKPKGGSPSGSSSSSSAKREREKNDPNAKAKAELAGLVAQYESTPWG